MTPAARVRAILGDLRRAGSAARREALTWYAPSAETSYGVSTPDMRRIARAHGRELATAPAEEVLAVARGLIDRGVRDGRHAAYEIVARHRPAMAALDRRTVEALGAGFDCWPSVDHFGTIIGGPAWRTGRIGDGDVARWARSKDRWWRRAALVATVGLNIRSRGGSADPVRTFAVCDRLAADRDDMVVKALSWALRELAKQEPAAVTGWLDEHDGELHARVVREVTRKLTTGRKSGAR